MSDYIIIDLSTELNTDQAFNILSNRLPEYEWCYGYGDLQEECVTGRYHEKVILQLWLRRPIKKITIDLKKSSFNDQERNYFKEKIIRDVIPKIGMMINIRAL